MSNEPNEAIVVNLFSENLEKYGVIDGVKEGANVSFDVPFYASPMVCHLLQGCMASTPWPKTV
jgi:hypothetical protein